MEVVQRFAERFALYSDGTESRVSFIGLEERTRTMDGGIGGGGRQSDY